MAAAIAVSSLHSATPPPMVKSGTFWYCGIPDQATSCSEYCVAFLEQSPDPAPRDCCPSRQVGSGCVATSSSVCINSCNVRGRTLLACVFDECSFWR
jgi:hypothetical protein